MVPILQRWIIMVVALGMMGSASAASLSTYAPNAYTYPVTQVEMCAAQLAQFIAQKRSDGVNEILFDGALALQVKKILDDLDSAAPAVMPDGEPGAYCKQVLATPVPVWHGGTVLHVAACYGYLQTIRVLCAAGASRSQPDMHGYLPMNIARIHGRSPCIYNVLDPAVNIDEVIAKFGMISVEYAGLTPLVSTVPLVDRRLNPTVAAWSPRQAPGDSDMVLPVPAIPAPVPEAAAVPVDPVQEACAQAKAELLALSDDYPHKYACTGQFKEFRLLVKAYERVPAGFLAKTPTGLTLLAAALLGGHNLVIDSLAKRSFQAGITLLDDDTRALIARYKLEEPLKIFVRVLATEEANKEKKAKEAADAAASAVAAAARAAHTPSGAGVAPWRDTSAVPAPASVAARRSPGSAGSPASGDREAAVAAPAVPAPVLAGLPVRAKASVPATVVPAGAGGAGMAKNKKSKKNGSGGGASGSAGHGGGSGAGAGDSDDFDVLLAKAAAAPAPEYAAQARSGVAVSRKLLRKLQEENEAKRLAEAQAAPVARARVTVWGAVDDINASPAFIAIKCDDVDNLRALLCCAPALLHYQYPNGDSLLHVAINFAALNVVAFLLEQGIDVKRTSHIKLENGEGITPFQHAVGLYANVTTEKKVERARIIELLIEHDIKVNAMARRANPCAPTMLQPDVLHVAIMCRLHRAIVALISDGFDVDTTFFKIKETPLHTAVRLNDADGAAIIRLLLDVGANPALATVDGETPLMLAQRLGHHVAAAAFAAPAGTLGAGHSEPVDVVARLHQAIGNGDSATIEIMLRTKACDVNAVDADGNSPLINAAVLPHGLMLIPLLMEHGADPMTKNRGRTARDMAEFVGYPLTVKGLLIAEEYAKTRDSEQRKILLGKLCKYADGCMHGDAAALQKEIAVPDDELPKVQVFFVLMDDNNAGSQAEAIDLLRGMRPATARTVVTSANAMDETVLLRAVSLGAGFVAALIDAGAHVNQVAHGQRTPLKEAVRQGLVDVVALLLERGAMPRFAGGDLKITPLHLITECGDEDKAREMARLLIRAGAQPGACTVDGVTPATRAERHNMMKLHDMLLSSAVAPAVPVDQLYTEETLLAMDSKSIYHVLKMSLEKVACPGFINRELAMIQTLHADKKITIDLNHKEGGETLLMLAVRNGHVDVVTWLLEHGGKESIDVPSDRVDDTPLMMAARMGHAVMLSSLLVAGARPDLTNRRGETARDLAEFAKEVKILGRSLREGAEQCISFLDCALRTQGGRKMAHVSLEEQTRARNALAVRTRPLDEPDKDGKTLLHQAARIGDLAICIELLEKSQKMITMPDREGWLPLHHAAGAGQLNIARLLVFYGADPFAITKHGKTAETIARERAGYPAAYEFGAAMYVGYRDRNLDEADRIFGRTPLVDALLTNMPEKVAPLLAENTAAIDDLIAGYTLLQHAAMRLNEPMVKLLLAHGADKKALSVDRLTPAKLLKTHQEWFKDQDRARYVAMLKLVS